MIKTTLNHNIKIMNEKFGTLLSDEQHKEFQESLPETVIQMSPACNCKTR